MIDIRKIITLFVLVLGLVACNKSNDSKINEFVSDYNRAATQLVLSNSNLKSSSAKKTGSNKVTIMLQLKTDKDDVGSELVRKIFPKLIAQVIKSPPNESALDIDISLDFYDKNGDKISSEKIDIKSIANTDFKSLDNGKTASKNQLNDFLNAFNSSLPMVDPSTGIKIVKIEAGNNNDIIYIAEVPDELKDVLKTDAAKELMKEEMLRTPQVKQLLMNNNDIGINKISYVCKDKNGNNISEITINQKDVK